MFGSKKKTFLDQVEEYASDIVDRLQPVVDNAREQAQSALADAKDKAGPALADARDKAGPALADARDKAAPYLDEARERFQKDVVPAVKDAVSDARDKAAPYVEAARDEASRRGAATAAALKGEVDAPKKGGKLKKVLLAGGLLGLGAFVFSKLKGDKDDPWQSTYTPPAPPKPASQTPGTAASSAQKPPAPAKAAPKTDDDAGASPDEALSDSATGGAKPVTTPDKPAEKTDVSKKPDPK